MTSAASPSKEQQSHPSAALQWFVLTGGGVAWFGRFLVVWGIAEFGCVTGSIEVAGIDNPVVLLTLVSIPFLLMGITAAVLGWTGLKSLPPPDAADPQASTSARFMLKTGLWTSALFVFIMLVEAVPVFLFMSDC